MAQRDTTRPFFLVVGEKATHREWLPDIPDLGAYDNRQFPQPHHVAPHFGVRTSRYKLVRFYGPHNTWELFDLQKDPHELKNEYHNSAYQKVAKELKQQLRDLIQQYDDQEAAALLNKEPGR